MHYVKLLTLLLLCACAPRIEPDFQPYVDRWNSLYSSHKVDVDMQYVSISGPYAGFCSPFAYVVSIDRAFFMAATDLLREEVLFHELGHCVLHLSHDKAIIKNTQGGYMPRSIMYPTVFGLSSWYKDNLDYYHAELGSHGG